LRKVLERKPSRCDCHLGSSPLHQYLEILVLYTAPRLEWEKFLVTQVINSHVHECSSHVSSVSSFHFRFKTELELLLGLVEKETMTTSTHNRISAPTSASSPETTPNSLLLETAFNLTSPNLLLSAAMGVQKRSAASSGPVFGTQGQSIDRLLMSRPAPLHQLQEHYVTWSKVSLALPLEKECKSCLHRELQ